MQIKITSQCRAQDKRRLVGEVYEIGDGDKELTPDTVASLFANGRCKYTDEAAPKPAPMTAANSLPGASKRKPKVAKRAKHDDVEPG